VPVVDYRCSSCFRDDSHYYPLASFPYPEVIQCPFCASQSERNYMAGSPSVGFSPIVIHIRKDTGEVSIPGRVDDPVEKGYERVEIRDFRAYEKFRRHVESVEKEKSQFFMEASNAFFDDVRREHRQSQRTRIEQAIRQGGYEATYIDEDGNEKKRWAPITQRARFLFDLACKYTDRTRDERRKKLASGSPNFHSRALEHRSSEASVVSGEAKRASLFFRKGKP